MVAYLVAWILACAIVVAAMPCPASKGVQPIAELNVVFKANWCFHLFVYTLDR